jgi:hypothetical protein
MAVLTTSPPGKGVELQGGGPSILDVARIFAHQPVLEIADGGGGGLVKNAFLRKQGALKYNGSLRADISRE